MTAVEPATASTATATGTAAAPARLPRAHVPSADVVRVLTFACVMNGVIIGRTRGARHLVAPPV